VVEKGPSTEPGEGTGVAQALARNQTDTGRTETLMANAETALAWLQEAGAYAFKLERELERAQVGSGSVSC